MKCIFCHKLTTQPEFLGQVEKLTLCHINSLSHLEVTDGNKYSAERDLQLISENWMYANPENMHS